MERPKPRVSDRKTAKEEYSQNRMVVYAGTSKRRHAFLQHVFPKSEIFSYPAGEEPDIPNVVRIMHGKIDNIISQLQEDNDIKLRKRDAVVIAADTRTNIFTTNQDSGCLLLESKGKPTCPDDVRSHFEKMYYASEISGVSPYYTILSGSGVHIREKKDERRLANMHTCTVELNPDHLRYLSTTTGFKDYLDYFEDFYASEPYEKIGIANTTISDVAGGVSLAVLTSMGVTQAVDGVAREQENFRSVLKHGIYTASVGISPDILKSLQPEIESSLNSWEWLEDVVDYTLS